MKVEIVSADHQNKPDVGSGIARQWYDVDKVDVIVDVPNSGVALAVSQIAQREEQGVHRLRRGRLRPHRAKAARQHRALDLRHLDARQRHRHGDREDRRRHLVLPHRRLRLRPRARARHRRRRSRRHGGKVLGKVRHPLNTSDFSSFLLQAQASKAKIIGLANAGGDTINSIKQAAEFGIVKGGQRLAGLLVFITDVHALGLQTAQGLTLTETCYWDLNDTNRAWTKRCAERDQGKSIRPWSTPASTPAVAALPQGGRGARRATRRQGGRRQDEGDCRPTIRCSARARSAPTAARSIRRLPVRGEEAGGVEGSRGTIYKLRATIPAERGVPAARRTAAARWSRS